MVTCDNCILQFICFNLNNDNMNSYFITYNGTKTVTITDLDAEHARGTLKKTIPGVLVINSTIKLKKDGQLSKRKERKTV